MSDNFPLQKCIKKIGDISDGNMLIFMAFLTKNNKIIKIKMFPSVMFITSMMNIQSFIRTALRTFGNFFKKIISNKTPINRSKK